MALSNKFLLLIVLLLALFQFSIATDYIVGDTEGWTSMSTVVDYDGWISATSGVDYKGWQVTEEAFKQCNPTSPIATYTTGSDKIVLQKAEHYYFLCGFPGHCQAGQKLDILVKPASSSDNTAGNIESNPMASSPSDNTASSATTPNTATVPMMVVAEAF
ncbi:hypothetical protein ACFE04_027629 [Oxalis oulophora]